MRLSQVSHKTRSRARKTRSRARKYRTRTRRGGGVALSKPGCSGAACSTGLANSPANIKIKMLTEKVSEAGKVLEALEDKKGQGLPVSNQELKDARVAFTAATDEMNKEMAAVGQQLNTAINGVITNAKKNLEKVNAIDEIMARNVGRRMRTPEENAALNAEFAEIEALNDPSHP